MTSPETSLPAERILQETGKRIKGKDITVKRMRSGYVVNRSCVIRYIGLEQGEMKMGLSKLTGGVLNQERIVTIEPFKRYEYRDDDQTHFYLWFGRQKGKNNPVFIIMSKQYVQPSSKIGIDFSASQTKNPIL